MPLSGGKGNNLGIMYNLGLPVPGGFVITSYSFQHFIHVTGIDTKIFSILRGLDVENNDTLQAAEQEIQHLILATPIPLQIRQAILEAYEHMNVDPALRGSGVESLILPGRDAAYVAVRSSATAEDMAEASFAGQMASYLNVKGNKHLLASILACWASLYTARAIYYRVKNNFQHEKILIAVVVQKMVNSEVAGVMFTVNPVTQNPDEILIEASYGLGEAVVSGAITPDEYHVKKKGFIVEKKTIAKKTWMYIRDTEKMNTVKVDVPISKQEEETLHPREIKQLAEYAVKLEEHYKKAQDIEFAIEKGKVYITQTRPITTLNKKDVKKEKISEEKKEDVHVERAESLAQGEIEERDAQLLVSGIPASPGIGKGIVIIVHDVADLKRVQKGNVLVSRMTSPDSVPAMERAEAIVTDAGGSTCFSG
ncbi:MAG: PEP/pyruvate-binding domain-containing protein, partial [bacterium]|nr:PEP/pyruvate-binding domain-containing protein [bacterium]